MAETVLNSAHEYCSRMAACGEGDGPCVVHLQEEINTVKNLLPEINHLRTLLQGIQVYRREDGWWLLMRHGPRSALIRLETSGRGPIVMSVIHNWMKARGNLLG